MTGAPSDRELLDFLRAQAGEAALVPGSRRPYRYATCAPLEMLRVRTPAGERSLIFKDLSRERLLGDAPVAKPVERHEPARELEVYRHILAPAGIGPRCYAVGMTEDFPRPWLLIEKVAGPVLWQVGELEVWEQVAEWMGRLHARYATHASELLDANSRLLAFSESWFLLWCERARSALAGSDDERGPKLRAALERYSGVAAELVALPRTFVHGELYPANVLVVREPGPLRVCPIDWEMSGIGPGLLDIAALSSGWEASARDALVAAYNAGLAGEAGSALPEASEDDLSRCRLHLALQWIGWARDWQPPPEHDHDWVDEALEQARHLGLA